MSLSLSVMTYNIHKGFGMGALRFALPEMRRALAGLSPDFLFLQEVQGMHQRRARRIRAWPNVSQLAYVADNGWPHYVYAKNAVYLSGHHGNAMLSQHPFLSFENINLSKHPRASRSILHATVDLTKIGIQQPLHLLCVHLGLFKSERALQSQAIIERIRAAVPLDEPLLMAGDFNDWQQNLSRLFADTLGLQEAHYYLHGHYARSFPALKPTLCVDRIYFRGLIPHSAQCFPGKPWRTLSDHLPVSAQFFWPHINSISSNKDHFE